MKSFIILVILSITIIGCVSSVKDKVKQSTEIGKQDIRYYADKTVNNLEVPPDLTMPTQKNALKLNKFIDDKNLTTFDDKENILTSKGKNIKIEVKKSGDSRWLVVKKDSNYIWQASKIFLKDYGFKILKSNKEIGILETNYLENKVSIPNRNLGFIRSMFSNIIGGEYVLPTIDKYRLRLEKIDNNTTEVYFSLYSMREVVTNKDFDDQNTIWQEKPTDKFVEVEMLYRFMIYLGSSTTDAKEKIKKTIAKKKVKVTLLKDINNFSKLQFNLNKNETWASISWVFDKLNITIEDKDKKDFSLYIITINKEDKGFMSKIFGDNAIKKNFQIKIKSIKPELSEVYFIDLSRENTQKTKEFSNSFFNKIAKQF